LSATGSKDHCICVPSLLRNCCSRQDDAFTYGSICNGRPMAGGSSKAGGHGNDSVVAGGGASRSSISPPRLCVRVRVSFERRHPQASSVSLMSSEYVGAQLPFLVVAVVSLAASSPIPSCCAALVHVRDLWPMPPHAEQRWGLFFREECI